MSTGKTTRRTTRGTRTEPERRLRAKSGSSGAHSAAGVAKRRSGNADSKASGTRRSSGKTAGARRAGGKVSATQHTNGKSTAARHSGNKKSSARRSNNGASSKRSTAPQRRNGGSHAKSKASGGVVAATAAKLESLPKPALIAAVAVLVIFFAFALASCPAHEEEDVGFPKAVEKWRSTVEMACEDCGLDTKWVDTILAMMQTESGGNTDVYSVVGCAHDIMQAGEGCAGVTAGKKNVVQLGTMGLKAWGIKPAEGFDGDTCTSSIYAGVLETKQNVELFESWLGPINVDKPSKVALIVQGYNYGADGWFAYCKKHKIKKWTLEASSLYQEIQPGGTVEHGQKFMDFYKKARADRKTKG